MIRERRNREKLAAYYKKYVAEGVLDPNVHPWVAEAWRQSSARNVGTKAFPVMNRTSKDELAQRQNAEKDVIRFMDGLFHEIREFFNINDTSLLLLDGDAFVLKSYTMSFYQKSPGELEGSYITEDMIGASSIGIAKAHKAPFLLYGPEIWIESCQNSDALTVPIIVNGQIRYMLTAVVMGQNDERTEAVVPVILTMKRSLELACVMSEKISDRQLAMDAIPFAIYQVGAEGNVLFSNKTGAERLERAFKTKRADFQPNLSELVLNYRLTQIPKGFLGIPSQNRELTWIIGSKTYEDIASVIPVGGDDLVRSVWVLSAPIEDLKTLVAYAAQYKARYSLSSLVGEAPRFISMKERAARVAKHGNHIIIMGEPGTGKQRLAHGIHQASPRAAGPLITVRCGDISAEMLRRELFGDKKAKDSDTPGKLALAEGGTLFLDEIDKMTADIGEELAIHLKSTDVRVIAAADVDPRKLISKGYYSEALYLTVAGSIIRTPALRQRQSDIPLLAHDILKELAEQHGAAPKHLSADALELLRTYDWPGNVKQLQGVLEQGFFNSAGVDIESDDLELPGGLGWGKTWKRDRAAFVEAWKASGGNISRLSSNLKVSRVTLYRYLEKYGLEKRRK